MRTSLRRDLTAALKARDHVTITALRSALASIDNAEAVPVNQSPEVASGSDHLTGSAVGVAATEAERRRLTEADVHGILEREIEERSAAAGEYERMGRHDDALRIRSEADVLGGYLYPPR